MKLGLFMMPLHDPGRPYGDVLRDDREAFLLADQLGYDEAWVGEHYSCTTEPIPDPLQFMATLIHQTKAITFATGVINLPQHHPGLFGSRHERFVRAGPAAEGPAGRRSC
jgi:alkanesulfonate monooxygenase SsuD/methylene tetrahydromethanopterin reductase-like flavin-dependent oxidoreductase (luciferase family)